MVQGSRISRLALETWILIVCVYGCLHVLLSQTYNILFTIDQPSDGVLGCTWGFETFQKAILQRVCPHALWMKRMLVFFKYSHEINEAVLFMLWEKYQEVTGLSLTKLNLNWKNLKNEAFHLPYRRCYQSYRN